MSQYTLTDRWGRTIVASGTGSYSLADGSITITAPNDAEAIATFNLMAPAGYQPPPG